MERIEKLKELLEKEPNDSFLLHALAMEYKKENRLEEACMTLESVLAYDPDYLGSYYQLAKIYEARGQIQAAIACYEKGISKARELNDKHACAELKVALEDITD